LNFWIVTPSYNQLEWLKLCVASVSDQASEAIKVHHHIQDACSSDGTPEWLEYYAKNIRKNVSKYSNLDTPYTFSYSSEKDEGMYDAINKGWKVANDDVDVVAHLNCDEQYLPDALQRIAACFEQNTNIDVVLADMIVVNEKGDYICHRRSLNSYALTSRFCCGGFTATTFHKLSVTRKKDVFFDINWKMIGDKVWYSDLHAAGCRIKTFNKIVSVFTETGQNLDWTKESSHEKKRYTDQFLAGYAFGVKVIAKINGLVRFLKEIYLKKPIAYSIYLHDFNKRILFPIENPTGRWKKKSDFKN